MTVDLRKGDRLDDNRANWDERVPVHVASDFYDQEPLRRGGGVLDPIAGAAIERMFVTRCPSPSRSTSSSRRGARSAGCRMSRRWRASSPGS